MNDLTLTAAWPTFLSDFANYKAAKLADPNSLETRELFKIMVTCYNNAGEQAGHRNLLPAPVYVSGP